MRGLLGHEGAEPGPLAGGESLAIAFAVGARPEREAVPHGVRRCAVTTRAALRIRLRYDDAHRPGRALGEQQLAQPELPGALVELHGLDAAKAALPGAAVEGEDEARVGPEENRPWILEACALEAAALEDERVAAALARGKRRDQLFDAADVTLRNQPLERGEIERRGGPCRREQDGGEQQLQGAGQCGEGRAHRLAILRPRGMCSGHHAARMLRAAI